MVRLRLTGTGAIKDTVATEVRNEFTVLKKLVEEYLVTDEDDPMQVVVSKLVLQKKKTVATAESCTGGYIAHLLTAEPGASAIFKGSVVSYANDVKQEVLHVSENTLTSHGAVSEETVREMLQGVLLLMKTDYAVAVSGIMGPDGGTADKPVGTVWIAAGSAGQVVTRKYNFRFDRRRNIELTAQNALNQLRTCILAAIPGA
jgi:nicotinamide-nucleotide amidase